MGLLDFEGESLIWEGIVPHIDYVKKHGLIQFLHNYEKVNKRPKDVLKWGDEVEYMILKFDHENKKVQVSLRGNELLETLQQKELNNEPNLTSLWRPEYAKYMVEGTPGGPYLGSIAQFGSKQQMVETNMKLRRREVQKLLGPDEKIVSLTTFPRLGCLDFTTPSFRIDKAEQNEYSQSIFFPDQAISDHIRFPSLTRNIRRRRGEKVAINVPIFRDTNTPTPFIERFPNAESQRAALPDHIYMDHMGFGMGNSCLQLTFQACNVDEATLLYDQLANLCPIMLALTAASPIYRGYLSDIDTRWQVISESVDDRTNEERGLLPLKKNKHHIRKSRYDSIDSYLSQSSKPFNDLKLEINEEALKTLLDNGVDDLIAQHISHLWVRDPVTLFTKRIELNDEKDYTHFENIQSTNWQSMRFKPPPAGSSIGWRVEFRVMELQLTDFENAAFAVFIVLLTRVILTYKLDFLKPISKVDENIRRAQKNNAVRDEKFYFRQNIMTPGTPLCCAELYTKFVPKPPGARNRHDSHNNCGSIVDNNDNEVVSNGHNGTNGKCSPPVQNGVTTNGNGAHQNGTANGDSHYNDVSGRDYMVPKRNAAVVREMTLDTIMNGKRGEFPGLIPLIKKYLDSVEIDLQVSCSIMEYLNLISKRASGEYLTTAQWMRDFVRSHPDYKFDSVVNDRIVYDLLMTADKIESGEMDCPELFAKPRHRTDRYYSSSSSPQR